VLATLVAIVVANNSASSLAQPAIQDAFDAGPADVGWIVFGFGSAFAVATALWGGLAGRFGLGRCLAVGVTLFAGGSLAAAFAPTLPLLVAARVVQGAGAGAVPTLSAAAISLQFVGPERARALGTVVAAVGLGLAAGPLLGGVTLELVGWQGPVAFGLVAAPTALLFVRYPFPSPAGTSLDLRGAGVVALAVIGLTFAVNRLPVRGIEPLTLAALVILALTLPLLVRRSARPGSFVPRRIVRDPAFTRVVALGSVGMSAFLGLLVLVPTVAVRAHGLNGIGLGLVILPLALVGSVMSVNNARVQERIGRRSTTLVSLASVVSGGILLAIGGPGLPPALLALALVPAGIGFGLLQAPLLNELTVAFDGPDRAVAVGLYNLAFFLGGSIGAALSTATVQAGLELAVFDGRIVTGFSTAMLVLAIGPALAVVGLLVGGRRPARDGRGTRGGRSPER